MSVQEECHVNKKAETEEMPSQTKECQKTTRSEGGAWNRSTHTALRRANPANTLISDFVSRMGRQ